MNGELGLLRLASPNNAFFAFLTLVNRLSISFGIAFKRVELGSGLPTFCMNFVGLEPATLIALIGSKQFLVKGVRISFER
jgi:hypothetical protein